MSSWIVNGGVIKQGASVCTCVYEHIVLSIQILGAHISLYRGMSVNLCNIVHNMLYKRKNNKRCAEEISLKTVLSLPDFVMHCICPVAVFSWPKCNDQVFTQTV